ncbi:MAG: SBBP repeat-containing protein, partial [Bryobacteraceae bacterium]
MNKILALMTVAACVGMAQDLQHAAKPAPRHVSFTGMPLSFEPNVGQSKSEAKFVAHGAGYDLQLGASGAKFQFADRTPGAHPRTLTMNLVNANSDAAIEGETLLPGKENYLPAKDPKTWFTNIPTYSRVKYDAIYPGVDAAFYGSAIRPEYDFLLQPGADPEQIRMRLSGSDQASINAAGDLVLRLGKGDVRFLKPIAYQTSQDGKRETVQAGYRMEKTASGEPLLVSFSLGSYDRTKPLVIDPAVSLLYSEYLTSYVGAVAVDSSGNTYVAGFNNSGGFYVTKLSSTGTVTYNTTVGTGYIWPGAIAVDSTGKASVAGYLYSSATLPTTSNAYQSTATGNEAFLAVLSSAGAVSYATFLDGADGATTGAQGVAVDSSGNAYVTGYTYSSNFPTTSGAYQTTHSPS